MNNVSVPSRMREIANEHSAPPPSKKSRTPVMPSSPLTPEELEADRELLEMMGLKQEDLSDERFRELRKLWT